ncbi:asparagine synthase (glutamine-hydrolyzing) [Pleomorphomonas oryzae]|uniref:asparagine synthase (glutamine-hydrolyzing) n=1 Tax=Pleomorphomonas oryzae TaxID=261934 RepID=UPI0004012E8D|nr:asparagine synthase (glutamine-hydrolyzing) [Pleomorphomonas oryzae]
MCGILGIISKKPSTTFSLTDRDLSSLKHRGPDAQGIYTSTHVSLGHTRLAIIDLTDGGRQPMASQDGRYIVTFNGEIYNFIELKAELEALGEQFHSFSDTEVLLSAYRIWGASCVEHFRGMFAFVLWDTVEQTAFLARDRCGEKPLFYHLNDEKLIFASELKALIPLLGTTPDLDPAIVDMYLHYQYVPEPHTLLKGVCKLPAAYTMTISVATWTAQSRRYWDIESTRYEGDIATDRQGILSGIRNGLEDAVKMTLRADVPVAVSLSGGIDSSVIAALAQKNSRQPIHAFSVGYPGRPPYDERHQAQTFANSLGMIFHEVELPTEHFVDFFPKLVHIMDEPIADPAAFGHFAVPQAAAENGIKVVLSGIGGDEVFWGYDWVTRSVQINEALARHSFLNTLPRWISTPRARKLLRKVSRSGVYPAAVRYWADLLRDMVDTVSPPEQFRFYMLARDFGDAFSLKRDLYGSAMEQLRADNPFQPTETGPRPLGKIPAAIIKLLFDTWLTSNALTLADRVSMGASVETRLPFLDHELLNLTMALRARTQDHNLGQKAWLRAALKGVLPDEILARPKSGFRPPVKQWLSAIVQKYQGILANGTLAQSGIISESGTRKLLEAAKSSHGPSLFFAYKLVLLEQWHREIVASV